MDNNSIGPPYVSSNAEEEDYYMAMLPKALHDYMMYDCVADVSAKAVYVKLQEMNEKDLLTLIKNNVMVITKKTYGKDYPL